MEKKYSIVCTDKRGVFFGIITKKSKDSLSLTLKDAQMCVF